MKKNNKNMKDNFYRVLNHTADVGFEVDARDKDLLFIRSAYALIDLMVDIERIEAKEEREIKISDSFDLESLFISWLGEILFYFETKGFLTSKVKKINFNDGGMEALVLGERYDEKKHPIKAVFKAPTYHNLKVGKENGIWVARVILDV
ncbi:MAG: archease [Candidatus Schekmanbacteria bacterium]|nr:MAG: archease [Candidatus Schekmanbacteria bacterium]